MIAPAPLGRFRETYENRTRQALDDLAGFGSNLECNAEVGRQKGDTPMLRKVLVEAARIIEMPVEHYVGLKRFLQEFAPGCDDVDAAHIAALDDDRLMQVAEMLDGACRRLGIVESTSCHAG